MTSSTCNNTNTTASATITTAVTTTSPLAYGTDSSSPNTTTFVQADPSIFRTIVQKLTGAPHDPSTQKLPITHPTRPATAPGPKRSAFKLQDRRPSAKYLQINLNDNNNSTTNNVCNHHHDLFYPRQRGLLVSPVSPLDFLAGRVSPRSPCEEFSARGSPTEAAAEEQEEEEETRAIAEKGFYLHPSPLSTPRGPEPPELLPLFPVRSPRDFNNGGDDDDCVNSCT